MKIASRSLYHYLKAGLCVLLVLNLHVWLGGCGSAGVPAVPANTRGILPPDHPLVQALESSALVGATGFEIDPDTSTFRVTFLNDTQRLDGRYAVGPEGAYTITELTVGRQGQSVTLAFDDSKRVTSIRTGNGIMWRAPAKPAASSLTPSSGGVQAYVDANVELLNFAREADRQAGVVPSSGHVTSVPGSGEAVDLSGLGSSGFKTESALLGSVLLFIFTTTVLIWAPILGTLQVLLSIFLVASLVQQMIAGIEPPPVNPVPTNGDDDDPTGSPPPELTDCNENGVDDADDIANEDSADCNSNDIPDECETDTDEDGTIDDCDFDLTVAAESDRAWVYEHLILQNLDGMEVDATNCPVVFSAMVTDDPLENGDYTFAWSIEPPADQLGALFEEVTGGMSDVETFRPPLRPGFSPSGLPHLVTVLATGNQHGNEGTATFTIDVRILGDVNNDGCVDLADDAILSDAEQGLITDPDLLEAADVNCDGTNLFGIDSSIVGFITANQDGFGSCVSPQ